MGFIGFLIVIGITVLIIVVFRLFGAWMLRINELIKQQREIITLMNRILIYLMEKKDTNEFDFLSK